MLLGSAAAALLIWLGWKWWPNEERAIGKLLTQLAEAASIQPSDSALNRLAYADRLASFFTTNATLHLEGIGTDLPAISSRTDLKEAAIATRLSLRQAEFRVADLAVTFPGEKRRAKASVVITGTINQETNSFAQSFRMELHKISGRWLIDDLKAIEQLR